MKSKIGIITSDDILFSKIKLILRYEADAVLIGSENFFPSDYDVIFADIRDGDHPACTCITLGEGGDIPLPFRHEDILEAIRGAGASDNHFLTVSADGKHAHLLGRTVTLTKLEYKLLARLLETANGEYVGRDELLRSVWDGECDDGIVTVYMHYLRKKLEANGERVIITKRSRGDCKYKIDERYRRKEQC